ncbi:MAG: hypothetical protein QM817_35860 [Archangium sp.]
MLAALLASGCLNFREQVNSCLDDGGAWVCPRTDAGVVMGVDAGSGDAGNIGEMFGSIAELQCARGTAGFCWDKPRPTGAEFESVYAPANNDVWIGSLAGDVIHLDDAGFHFMPLNGLRPFSFCSNSLGLFVGGERTGLSASGLRQYAGASTWMPIPLNDDVQQVQCTSDRVYFAAEGGGGYYDGTVHLFHAANTTNELCSGIAVSATQCRLTCARNMAIDVYECDGGLAQTITDGTVARGDSEEAWVGGDGGIRAIVQGDPARVFGENSPAWTSVITTGPAQQLYAGIAYGPSSLVVGRGDVVSVEGQPGFPQPMNPAKPPTYLSDVDVDSTGTVWAVGTEGRIVKFENGAWSFLTPDDTNILYSLDHSRPGRVLVVGVNGTVLLRDATGWSAVPSSLNTHVVGVKDTEAGLILLGYNELRAPNLAPVPLNGQGRSLLVIEDRYALVTTTAEVTRIDLTNGNATQLVSGAFAQLAYDGAQHIIYAGSAGNGVWASADGGSFARIDGGPAMVNELVFDRGQLWVAGDGFIYLNDGIGWLEVQAPGADNLAPVSSTVAAAWSADHGWRVKRQANGLVLEDIPAPPAQLSNTAVVGDEIWGVGKGGAVVRLPISSLPP